MSEITIDIVNDEIRDFKNPVAGAFVQFGNPIQKLDDAIIHREFMPWWLGTDTALDKSVFLTVDRIGVISGTVKVQGVLQVKSRVNLYYRKSGQLIQSTFTDANGAFSFQCGLNRTVADYYAVAITEQPFNAQIFDKLQPI
jgi:hypothetical protein